MDDPWANAWEEPSKPSPHSLPSTSAWSAPPVSTIHNDHDTSEGDLSLPSWSVQPTTAQWSDPDTAEALWTDNTSTVWNPFTSTIDKGSLSTDSHSEIEVSPPESTEDVQESRSSSPPASLTPKDDISPASPTSDSSNTPLPPHSPQLTTAVPPALSIGPVEDIDAFGTFETANGDAESEDWSISKPNFSIPSADAAVWGGSWEASSGPTTADAKSEANLDVDDAWEVARQQKEKQDQHVPPELLASILQQFENISEDLWPSSAPSPTSARDSQLPIDMEEHFGLAAIALRLVPENLTLPASVPFSKTFTSKQMSEALKMTRHTPLTRISPMTFYMSSKGLTSWEAFVKAKPNFLQEDFTPAGWKILEIQKTEALSADDVKKKPNGGLLSFFGRRTTNSPLDTQNAPTARSTSPISNSGTSSVKPGTSPRPSIDSGRRSTSQSLTGGATAPSSPSVVSFGANTPTVTVSTKDTNPLPESVTSTISAGSPEIEVVPQPSAVSRFLGRFSSRSAKSNSRDSLTLSSDDLEFLSDVPTVGTSPDTSTGLDALSIMIKSPPIPTALPPPLKPPPRAPPQISKPIPKEHPPADDFISFFDNDSQQVPSGLSLSPLKPVPTPPVIALTQLASSSTQALPATITSNSVKPSEQTLDTKENNNNQSWPSFDYPSIPMSRPAPTKRPFVAIMSTSSSKPTSTTPPLLPKPTTGFVLSNPPSLSRRTTIGSGPESRSISPLPPPPTSRARTPHRPLEQASLPPAPPPLTTTTDDDDDFADFLSSPSDTTQTTQLSFGHFAPSKPILNQTTTTQQTSTSNLFDDFDDFVSPPPQPPAKPVPPKSFSPPSRSPSVPKNANHINNHKPIRVANHSKTLSLMENVAARGRWLAPPSPLPEALPPPEANGVASTVDFFSSGSSMQYQQAQVTASLTAASAASPSFSSSEQPPLWNFGPSPTPNRTFLTPIPQSTQATFPAPSSKPQSLMQPLVAQTSPPASTGTKTGGLSAQDLSFFEGL